MYGFVSLKCDVKILSLCFFIGIFMGIIEKINDRQVWEEFFIQKETQGNISEKDLNSLKTFIDKEEYKNVYEKIVNNEGFSIPKKTLINKKAGKKRVVYTFSENENYVLKLISFLLKDYDHIFTPNLYSFRKNTGVKKAVDNILRIRNLDNMYVFKIDISNYFNSVDIQILLPMLKDVLCEDETLYRFFETLLSNPYAQYEDEIIKEEKGIMAGVPVSAFLANLYLKDLDRYFFEKGIPYMRYSDDILVFAKDEKELSQIIDTIKTELKNKKLTVNEDKECITKPNEKWTFLGFSYHKGIVDISDVSFEKLKAKMRRKARSLSRWASKKNVPPQFAARAFVKRFNTKLYDNPVFSELTWTRWFFPVINTSATLKKIDEYMLDCIRYLATGTRTKSRFNFTYEDIKALGYRSLVHEYYKEKDENEDS